jgi:hypothetical protein
MAAINARVPAEVTLYRGWGLLHRRFGDEVGDGTATSGLMTNDLFLIDPEAECADYTMRHDIAAGFRP